MPSPRFSSHLGRWTLPALLLSLPACNSPKAFDQQTEGIRSFSETVNIVGVRGILGGVARNPVSGALRGMHHAAALTTSLLDPGMSKLNGSTAPPPAVTRAPGMNIAHFEAELDRKIKPARARGTLKLLLDAEFFSTLSSTLRTAREPVDVQVYIFDTDDVAIKVADELKAASQRVPVRVLFDDLGTQQACLIQAPSGLPKGFEPPPDILAYLKQDSKIDARRLHNIFLTSTHTKIITVGTSRAFIGGMNIGREYRYDWHDMMADVRGPVVGLLKAEVDRAFAQTHFGGDFLHLFSRSSRPGRNNRYQDIPEPPGAYDIRVLHTRAFAPQIERAIHLAIRSAKRRIWIENPYFADDRIIRELLAARDRGVDVRVILPSDNNQKVMAANNNVTAAVLLEHGIRVYFYPRAHHVKAALFDDWALMGSANFDHLSLRLNEEVNIAYSHPAAVREIESRLFLTDFRASKEATPGSIKPDLNSRLAEMLADQL